MPFRRRRKRLLMRRILIVAVAVILVAALIGGVALIVHTIQEKFPFSPADEPTIATTESTITTTTTATTTTATKPKITATTGPVYVTAEDYIADYVQAPRFLLYDRTADAPLYTRNIHTVCAPASLTKLMTAIVALETADLDTVITAGNELYLLDPQSSRAGLYLGYRMTLRQALQALLLPSGNDAAYIIAAQLGHMMDESLSGQAAIDLFCRCMTEKARELGCENTVFLNPDGIDKEGHQTTASDLLKITLHALQDPFIVETVAEESITTTLLSGQTITFKSSNKLMRQSGSYAYEGTIGMKTGTTDGAGSCLISLVERDGRQLLCILLGARNDKWRYRDTITLLDIGFDGFNGIY